MVNYMKALLKKLMRILYGGFTTKKTAEETTEVDEEKGCAGKIVIEFTPEGQFTVITDITDFSDKSVETFSWLLHHIAQGQIVTYMFESLQLWADKDEDKLAYNARIAQALHQIDQLLDAAEQEQGEGATNSGDSDENVAISASQVFNLRGLN
jgi:hypothetical protein